MGESFRDVLLLVSFDTLLWLTDNFLQPFEVRELKCAPYSRYESSFFGANPFLAKCSGLEFVEQTLPVSVRGTPRAAESAVRSSLQVGHTVVLPGRKRGIISLHRSCERRYQSAGLVDGLPRASRVIR